MAEPTAPQGTPPPRHFGHGPLAHSLAREILDSLRPASERTSALQPKTREGLGHALVVGVFGEWGAGKSFLLKEVGEAIKHQVQEQAHAVADGKVPAPAVATLNVLVDFNAWRYEREPHLLIPMLKVAEEAVREAVEALADGDTQQREWLNDHLLLMGELIKGVYTHGGREALNLLMKAGGVDLTLPEIKPEDEKKAEPGLLERWGLRKKEMQAERKVKTPIAELESLYFNFYKYLKGITGRNPAFLAQVLQRLSRQGSGPLVDLLHKMEQAGRWVGTGETKPEFSMHLNLIFLVDDLDRCLPENAIEVLEAVKLFLDVEGCAFVLALDEEVVERGIAHRYQAYTSAAQGQTPITGAEYLEKLIHLPIRLPRPGGEEAQLYLAAHWPVLYAKGNAGTGASGAQPDPNELAQLVATLTPPVPRKLQRITSLVQLNQALAGQLEAEGGSAMPAVEQRRWLTLMCALQLFAPALFRYLRVQGAWLMQELVQWRQTLRLGDLKKLAEDLRQDTQAVTKPYELRNAYARERLPELLQGALSSRSGFSLLTWLEQVQEQTTRAAPDAKTLQRLLALAVAESGLASTGQAASPLPASEVSERASDGAASSDVRESPDPSPVAPEPPAKPWPASPVAERARLDNEFALWEPLAAGDAKAFEMAISREGAALAGKFLPESTVERLIQAGRYELSFWLYGSIETRQQMADLLAPLLTQGDVLRLCGLAPENLTVFNRPSWGQVLHWKKPDSAGPFVPIAKAPWTQTDGETVELALAPSVDSKAAQALVARRAWLASPIHGAMPSGDWTLGADGEYGLYLDLHVRGVTQRLRWIEPGNFLMGSPDGQGADDEHPQHEVHLSQGFWLADTPCTNAFWQALMRTDPGGMGLGDDTAQRPVVGGSFDAAQDFANKLSVLLPGKWMASLPSEAEWEYACRAGTTTAYWWGDEPNDSLVNRSELPQGALPVMRLPPNPWGLHGMNGNVREWCADGGPRNYSRDAAHDPVGEDRNNDTRMLRGGSWLGNSTAARSSRRQSLNRVYSHHDVGFRIALKNSGLGEMRQTPSSKAA